MPSNDRSTSIRPRPVLLLALGTAVIATAPLGARWAAAGPPPTPRVEEFAAGTQREPARINVAGPLQANVRRITLPPGSSTGPHCHHGQVVAVVRQGTLTLHHPSGVFRYRTGQSLVEGAGYVHEGRNNGRDDLVLWVTYLTPAGRPLAETDLSRCRK